MEVMATTLSDSRARGDIVMSCAYHVMVINLVSLLLKLSTEVNSRGMGGDTPFLGAAVKGSRMLTQC